MEGNARTYVYTFDIALYVEHGTFDSTLRPRENW